MRPIDELAQCIRADTHIEKFFEKYGPSRGCAMALHIAVLGEPILQVYHTNPQISSLTHAQEKARAVFLSKAGSADVAGGQSNPSAAALATNTCIQADRVRLARWLLILVSNWIYSNEPNLHQQRRIRKSCTPSCIIFQFVLVAAALCRTALQCKASCRSKRDSSTSSTSWSCKSAYKAA
jgi:hypothetical protein